MPSPPRPPAPRSDSFDKIARYLSLADIALNNDHPKSAAKSARIAEEARAQQADLENRMRQLIETYRSGSREPATEIKTRTSKPHPGNARKLA
jgi:hypothetical protein